MSTLPTTPDDHSLFDGNVVIDQVEATLRRFGGDLSQQDAVRLLGMWRKNSQLTARERAAILARFQSSDAIAATTLQDKAFEHAFTVDFDPDAQLFAWTCLCGWQHAQALDERDIRTALIMHIEGGADRSPGQAQREIGEYRKRLDVWSREQTRALDELEPEA